MDNVAGEDNPADFMTKNVGQALIFQARGKPQSGVQRRKSRTKSATLTERGSDAASLAGCMRVVSLGGSGGVCRDAATSVHSAPAVEA